MSFTKKSLFSSVKVFSTAVVIENAETGKEVLLQIKLTMHGGVEFGTYPVAGRGIWTRDFGLQIQRPNQ